jgi:hypothetical protein
MTDEPPKRDFWETPRNIVALLTAVAAIAGVLGFKFGRQPAPVQQIQLNFPPGTTIHTPEAKP